MIFVLAIVLGIAGVIPPEHFDGWCWAILAECVFGLPTYLAVSAIYYHRSDKRRESQGNIVRVSQNKGFPDEVKPAVRRTNEVDYSRYLTNIEYKNPYAKDTLRWRAWEEAAGNFTCHGED